MIMGVSGLFIIKSARSQGAISACESRNGTLDTILVWVQEKFQRGTGSDPRRTRTYNPQIKSLLLYQLS